MGKTQWNLEKDRGGGAGGSQPSLGGCGGDSPVSERMDKSSQGLMFPEGMKSWYRYGHTCHNKEQQF